MAHLFASVGSATAGMEALASSIGAGALIGGFLGGLARVALDRSLAESEEEALRGGYVGGVAGLMALAFDILGKYFV